MYVAFNSRFSRELSFPPYPLHPGSTLRWATQAEEAFTAVVYNPLAQRRVGFIDVPISWSEVCVTDGDGKMIESQVLPFRHHNLITRGEGSNGGQRQHPYTLMLPVEKVRPFSVGVFHVSRGKGRQGLGFRMKRPGPEESVERKEPWHTRQPELEGAEERMGRGELTPDAVVDDNKEVRNGAGSHVEASLSEISRNLRANIDGGSSSNSDSSGVNFTISNDLVTLTFDGATGRLSRMETLGGIDGEGKGASLDVDQGWFFYPSFGGGENLAEKALTTGAEASTRFHQEVHERLKGSEEQKGGAYIFRPEVEGNESGGIPVGSSRSGVGEERGFVVKEWWIEEGPLVSEVHQVIESILVALNRGRGFRVCFGGVSGWGREGVSVLMCFELLQVLPARLFVRRVLSFPTSISPSRLVMALLLWLERFASCWTP